MSRSRVLSIGLLISSSVQAACASDPARPGASVSSVRTLDDLARLSVEELDELYTGASPGPMPNGRVRGRPLLFTGTTMAVPASRVGRVFWQGKIFKRDEATAVNRFLGVRIVRGELYEGTSWFDGRPALILDYAQTSRLYRPYRDEIREVAPGLYLGRMYERTTPSPTQTLLFALEQP